MGDQAGGDPAAVGSAVQGEVVPTVGIPLLRPGREIRGIREQSVKSSEAAGQVGSDEFEVDALRARPPAESVERVRIEVGRDHSSATSCRRERREAVAGTHLDEPRAPRDLGEGQEESRILAGRIDRRLPVRWFRVAGGRGRERRVPAMPSYWLHAYNTT